MPPKKQQPKGSSTPTDNNKQEEPPKQEATPSTTSTTSTKRKRAPKATSDPNKIPRRSARSANSNTARPSPVKTLSYLLSASAAPLSSPSHETDALSSDSTLRAYTSTIPLTPFEELLGAVILSRPISHSLGQRALRYLINPPRNLTTPAAVQALPEGQVHTWLDEARTQHKAKTAEQIRQLADLIVEKGWAANAEDAQLTGLRRKMLAMDTRGSLQGMLMQIKGLGETGTEIFMRRVQGVWGELSPFVDARTEAGLGKLGLPCQAEELVQLIEESWATLDVGDIGGEDEEARKRLVFVKVLERAVGADLEGNVGEMLAGAAKA